MIYNFIGFFEFQLLGAEQNRMTTYFEAKITQDLKQAGGIKIFAIDLIFIIDTCRIINNFMHAQMAHDLLREKIFSDRVLFRDKASTLFNFLSRLCSI